MSFKTRPGALSYRYRLKNYEVDWSCTNEQKVEYRNIPKGAYVFEVVAIDRDLVYTPQSATQRLKVIADPRLEALTEALSEWGKSREFIGKSEVLLQVQSQITEVAQTDLTVMILGETGTGKGLAALAMHALSRQKTGPFIQVNCGAIPEGLVESELFGHERGAFTGANARKLGKAELATGGTLFLDEIGDLALEAQVKILRLLEDLTFERVGGTESLKAEVRIIAATNRDLVQMVNEGKFRSDLYFRLQTFPIHLPPLRERREDIPLIAAYYISNMSDHLKKEVKGLHPEAMAALQAYDWPGNVRELENVIKRAVIICQESVLRLEDMALGAGKELDISEQNLIPPSEYEKRYIQKILERAGGVIRKAADIWGVPESTLRSRMKKLGIRIKKSGIVQ
jgi:transcriptional regulator with GAF, ATPase, and Fis domain